MVHQFQLPEHLRQLIANMTNPTKTQIKKLVREKLHLHCCLKCGAEFKNTSQLQKHLREVKHTISLKKLKARVDQEPQDKILLFVMFALLVKLA